MVNPFSSDCFLQLLKRGIIMQDGNFSFMQVQYLISPRGCCIIVIKFLLVHAAAAELRNKFNICFAYSDMKKCIFIKHEL